MPRDFVPHFYGEQRGRPRAVVGAECGEEGGGRKVYVQFTGGEYGVYDRVRLATALGLPADGDALCRALLAESYAVLRAIPGSFRFAGDGWKSAGAADRALRAEIAARQAAEARGGADGDAA